MKVLIYGAGAIGRGYLAPLLIQYGAAISFVDINKNIIDLMKKTKKYTALTTTQNGYDFIDVSVSSAYLLDEEDKYIEKYDIVFSCVGPEQCYDLAKKFRRARVVISCENDISTVEKLRNLSGNPQIYFGIPDVITSNTAPTNFLDNDPLTIVSEEGELVLEQGNYYLPSSISQVSYNELIMHWMCKLFIHNAPHAIVAYLGHMKGYQYIHEGMNDPEINKVVIGSINEITEGVIASKYAEESYAAMYRDKEISRFSNKYLYDTIERVAREPIRKLSSDNRLILGMRIAQFNGIKPYYTSIGIKAALYYNNPDDTQSEYISQLRSSIGDEHALKEVAGLELYDPIIAYIVEQDLIKFQK